MVTASPVIELADELNELAAEIPSGERLGDLESALRDLAAQPPAAERARHWATVDLFAAFLGEGSDGIGASPSREWLWRIVDTAVQILVFVPIAVTWLGLGMATRAYRSAAAAGALHGESFLQGWQDGFGGRLLSWLTFGHIAFYTFGLVFLLILATAAHLVHHRRNAEHDAELRQRLASALARADLVLASVRLDAPEDLAQELSSAMDKLREAAVAIQAAGEVAVGSQQKAVDALTAVVPVLSSVENAADAVSAAAETLERAPDKLTSHLDQLTRASGDIALAQRGVTSSVGDAAAKIAGALQDGAGQVRASLAEASTTAAAYTHRAEQAADILGQAHQAIGKLPTAVTELGQEIAGIGSQVSNLAAAIPAVNGVPSAGPSEWSAPIQTVTNELRVAAADLRASAVAMQQLLDSDRKGRRRFPLGRLRKP